MIGSMSFVTAADPDVTAILGDDGSWECSSLVYQQLLNQKFRVVNHQPSDGAPGHRIFHEAVAYFSGKIIYRPVQPVSEPGVVY
jgi:hypothetical protein